MGNPISNLNQNTFSAVQQLNGGRLDASKAAKMKEAILADNQVDAQEQSLVKQVLGGASSFEVQAGETAGFEPLTVSFDGVDADAVAELDDIQTIAHLQDSGFIQTGESGRSYEPKALKNASAEEISKLVNTLDDGSKKNQAPVFFLKVAGANLTNASERKAFIQKNILGDEKSLQHDMKLMNQVLTKKPDHQDVASAFEQVVKNMEPEQAHQFLKNIGFASIDSMASHGSSINQVFDRDAVAHLSDSARSALKDVLNSASLIGGGVFRRAAGQL